MKIDLEKYEKLGKEASEKMKARNEAVSAIEDAKARYIKKKTRARSRKAALEKDAVLNGPRYRKIELYDNKSDIQDAYGYGFITESEMDRLNDLWDEREELKTKTVDGVYSDLVTECLEKARLHVLGFFEDEIFDYEMMKREYEKQAAEDEERARIRHEDYKAWKNGWGKYAPSKEKEE